MNMLEKLNISDILHFIEIRVYNTNNFIFIMIIIIKNNNANKKKEELK